MYVVVNHAITNPENFWSVLSSNPAMPEGFKVHAVLPGADSSKAVCIWQAPDLASLQQLVTSAVGLYSENSFMEVNENKSIGLPQ